MSVESGCFRWLHIEPIFTPSQLRQPTPSRSLGAAAALDRTPSHGRSVGPTGRRNARSFPLFSHDFIQALTPRALNTTLSRVRELSSE